MDEFHNHINSINEKIQFTYEVENNKSIAYLDICFKRQQDNSFKFVVYRKPSNTGRLLDYNSYAPASHKIKV